MAVTITGERTDGPGLVTMQWKVDGACPNCPDHGPFEGGYGICECDCHPATKGELYAFECISALEAENERLREQVRAMTTAVGMHVRGEVSHPLEAVEIMGWGFIRGWRHEQ